MRRVEVSALLHVCRDCAATPRPRRADWAVNVVTNNCKPRNSTTSRTKTLFRAAQEGTESSSRRRDALALLHCCRASSRLDRRPPAPSNGKPILHLISPLHGPTASVPAFDRESDPGTGVISSRADGPTVAFSVAKEGHLPAFNVPTLAPGLVDSRQRRLVYFSYLMQRRILIGAGTQTRHASFAVIDQCTAVDGKHQSLFPSSVKVYQSPQNS